MSCCTGALLAIFGLLIAPAATANLLVHRIPLVIVTASALGATATVLGLAVSYHEGTAAGATIAGLSVAGFFVVLLGQEAVRAIRATGRTVPGGAHR